MKQLLLLFLFVAANAHTTIAMEEEDKPHIEIDEEKHKLNGQLVSAAARGDLEEVKKLVASGADINMHEKYLVWVKGGRCRYKATPIYVAMDEKRWPIVEFLVGKGANPNLALGPDNNTPLHMTKLYSMHKFLLDHGAEPNLKNSKGETPLHYAIRDCRDDLVKLYLQHGANVEIQNIKNSTPFHIAGLTMNYCFGFFDFDKAGINSIKHMLHAVLFKDTHSTKGLITAFSYFSKKCPLLYKQRYNLLLPHLQDQLSFQALMRMLKAQNQYAKPFAKQAIPEQLSTQGEKLKQLLQIQDTEGHTAHEIIEVWLYDRKDQLIDPEAIDPHLQAFLTALHKDKIKQLPDNNIFKAAYQMIPTE